MGSGTSLWERGEQGPTRRIRAACRGRGTCGRRTSKQEPEVRVGGSEGCKRVLGFAKKAGGWWTSGSARF